MRKKTYLCIACLAAFLFSTVQCTDDDFMAPPRQAELEGFTLEEAKALFREEAEKYSVISRLLGDDSRVTLSPGDFVPEWESATAAVRNGLACYNVPITGTTYRFKALSVEQRGNSMQASQVNVYQKLVIVKNLQTGNKSQYILTLIPTPSYAARHASGIAESFVNCGGKDGYSGLAVYTCVYAPITAHVSRYKDGRRVQKIFLLDTNLKSGELRNAVELARSMTASISIQRGKVATTRYEDDWGWDIDGGGFPEVVITPDDGNGGEIDGGELPEIDVYPDSDQETNPGSDNNGDGGYEEPEPIEPTEDTAEDQDTSGNNDKDSNTDPEKEQLTEELNKTMPNIAPILSKCGIDIGSYTIRVNTDACTSTARVLPDGTIEVCTEFFKYSSMNDRASIIWHEIYHINEKHNKEAHFFTGKSVTLERPSEETEKNILDGLDKYLDWYFQNIPPGEYKDFLKDGQMDYMLIEQNIRDQSWYQNEVETYKAELENDINRSDYYEGLINFQIWKYEQLSK